MRDTPEAMRRAMGCGWLPRSDEDAQRPPHVPLSEREGLHELTTCPVYTTELPDVVDIVTAWMHWSKGQLSVPLAGLDPSPALIHGVELLEGSVKAHDTWQRLEAERRRKGGAQ